jgi:hypothetical protein
MPTHCQPLLRHLCCHLKSICWLRVQALALRLHLLSRSVPLIAGLQAAATPLQARSAWKFQAGMDDNHS